MPVAAGKDGPAFPSTSAVIFYYFPCALNSLISLKIIFTLYRTDFWQGQFPEAVEMRDCLTRTCGCAGREGEAEQDCLWRWDTPLVPRFALLQGFVEAHSKEPVHKHFKNSIST